MVDEWRVVVTDEFDEWFQGIDAAEQEDVRTKVNLLRQFGPTLRRPHADTLNGSKHANMKELRVRTARSELRVAFAFDPERVGVLVVAGDKAGGSTKRFYKDLIDRADRLFDEHLAEVRGGTTHGDGHGKKDV